MATITRLESGSVSKAVSSFAPLNIFPFPEGRFTIYPAHSFDQGIADRMSVHGGNDCSDCVQAVCKVIGNFFSHRYADFRMFWRAYSSMGGTTTTADIHRRIDEVNQFRTVLTNPNNQRVGTVQRARNSFIQLSSETRSLFYYVDDQYIQRYINVTGTEFTNMRHEILRECEQVISYQRTLTSVNVFFQRFSGRTPPLSTVPGGTTTYGGGGTTTQGGGVTTDGFDWNYWWHQFWGGGGGGGGGGERPRGVPVTTDGTTISRDVLLGSAIPGAVKYPQAPIPANLQADWDREYRARLNDPTLVPHPEPIVQFFENQLPQIVRDNAAEIRRLKTLYVPDHLHPDDDYTDIISSDIMDIPVFDASHPDFLAALQTTHSGSAAVSTLDNNAIKHPIDLSSMVSHLLTNRSQGNRAKCVVCRHPENEHRAIDRQHLFVDSALQSRTLAFLRARTGGGGTTT